MTKVNRFVAIEAEPDKYGHTWVICDTFTLSFYLGLPGLDIRKTPFTENVEDVTHWYRRGHTDHALAILNEDGLSES